MPSLRKRKAKACRFRFRRVATAKNLASTTDTFTGTGTVENAFLHIKQWRGIATRYAKRLDSFLAAVQIRCLALWLQIS